MHREIAELFMYGDLDKNSILYRLGEIFEAIDSGSYNRQQVIREVKVQLKRLLVLATDYGFDKNLWHNYIAFFLLMNENPFSLVCEKSAVSEGTVTSIVKEDFAHIRRIFLYDFSAVEQALGDAGRILVRESGTEPLVRVMVEAETDQLCHDYVYQVVDVIKAKGHEVE